MFSCCCANKKAVKKAQIKAAVAAADGDKRLASHENESGKNEQAKQVPQNFPSSDVTSLKSPTRNDKSNSSDEDNNLSGLIISDGLVEEIEIQLQLKNQIGRKRSNDTTSGCSNVTVIEGNSPEDDVVGEDESKIVEVPKAFEDVKPPSASVKNNEEKENNPTTLPSCLFRRDSARASIKKKVRCSEAAEIIPPSDYIIIEDDWREIPHEDDDDVFSDNAPVQTPRGNMCTPYVERKSSLPGLEALPNWFPTNSLIGRLETIVNRLEHSVPTQGTSESETSTSPPKVSSSYSQTDLTTLDERYLPTVLPHIEQRLEKVHQEQRLSKLLELFNCEKAMSVNAYEDIILGSLAQYLELSKKIGDDVATQSDFVKKAFDAQLKYVTMASQSSAPDQSELPKLLQPTSEQINNVQNFREKHRTSKFFNHLSAISESIPALGWVCVSPTPGPHVKEMNDAGQFYTNRVLKEWKDKDVTHVNWAKAWVQTLTELQQYIKQHHTTGIVWAGKSKATANGTSGGAPPPPPMGNLPPPPPMPAFDPTEAAANDERNALFAQINQGADITKNLKKVTSEMQTHKNPTLRSGPAPFKATGPAPFKPAIAVKPNQVSNDKPPVFNRDGKKWIIEYQKNNPNLIVDNAEMNNVVYMFKSENSTLTVKGKLNSIVIDSCKKCSVVFDSLVSSVEFVNCQKIQMQVLGKVPTISIDKTDGCQMYLNRDTLNVEIVSSKSSEMNVMLPTPAGDDYVEMPIPEQFKTVISGKNLQTTCVESLG
ncbi:CLUMA_CG017159, isoform B [Clunio marinus]|uniref:CLUMA_CG017159, isoform B n=1 Tax=Clunio marinus TaxID=568069 RepID=A0A1J1IV10_9DIPT|nr:CLUMA_CG017159, isoform B [Clunio marinus]